MQWNTSSLPIFDEGFLNSPYNGVPGEVEPGFKIKLELEKLLWGLVNILKPCSARLEFIFWTGLGVTSSSGQQAPVHFPGESLKHGEVYQHQSPQPARFSGLPKDITRYVRKSGPVELGSCLHPSPSNTLDLQYSHSGLFCLFSCVFLPRYLEPRTRASLGVGAAFPLLQISLGAGDLMWLELGRSYCCASLTQQSY